MFQKVNTSTNTLNKIGILPKRNASKGIHNMLFHSFLTALANFTTFSFGSLLY